MQRGIGGIGHEVDRADGRVGLRERRLIRLKTARLILRPLEAADAPFTLALLNDPEYLRFIGDKGARDLDAARRYIEQGPQRMYAEHGMGLLAVELQDSGTPIGMCGLIRRPVLADVDLGFALLAPYRSRGYALEASRAVLEHGRQALGLRRVVAIVVPHNRDSIELLRRLGMERIESIRLPGDPAELDLYAIDLGAASVAAAPLAAEQQQREPGEDHGNGKPLVAAD
jgi:[ribosomal protein S5]-alanine N-acetyltransferase